MNKIKDFIIRHKMTLVVLFGLALGIGIGYVAFHKGGSGATASSENKKTIWTCTNNCNLFHSIFSYNSFC